MGQEGTSHLDGKTALFQQIMLSAGLCAAVFLAATYSMTFPRTEQGINSVWLANGISVAALLRSPSRSWPLLIVAAMAGNAGAIISSLDISPALMAYRVGGNALQYWLGAYLLRRKLGVDIDITSTAHLLWIGFAGVLTTSVKLACIVAAYAVLQPDIIFTPGDILPWLFTNTMGLFVLLFPILAITAPRENTSERIDAAGGLCFLILAAILYLIFGPPAFPGVYLTIPPLMLLAWRHGLLGAGLGTLLTIALAAAFGQFGGGLAAKLVAAGYSPMERGNALQLFYTVAILTSIPLAVARSRQRRMAMVLENALAEAEARAEQLAVSEAAAVSARAALVERMKELNCIYQMATLTLDPQEDDEEVFQAIVDILPNSLLHPEIAVARVVIDQRDFRSRNWAEPEIRLTTILRREGAEAGLVEVGYPHIGPDDAPRFLPEEHEMMGAIAIHIEKMLDRQAMSQRLSQAERLSAIGELTGGVAHDFNNLLTVVIGSSETLANKLERPEQRSLAELILRAAERGATLVRQLLAFARRQALVPRALDVNQILDDSAPLIRESLGGKVVLAIEGGEGLGFAYADPTQTEAAILNLCINARDAMPDGGRITIRTEQIRVTGEDALRIEGGTAGDYVAISVQDSGTGIAPDLVDRIFEPFFTTKETGRGSGLGLSMVYGFVKQSGGYVELDTELGRGSIFTIMLPTADATDLPALGGQSDRDGEEGGSENILLVEDDDLVRSHVCRQLASLGYHVVEAARADTALEILKQREDIDLLFTDIAMPGGMNGCELGEEAAAHRPSLRILYTSGYARDGLIARGRLSEGVNLLAKPYSNSDLAEKVRHVLDEVPPS